MGEEGKPSLGVEIVKASVAEIHVHATLGVVAMAVAHKLDEEKIGLLTSGLIIVSSFAIKRHYPRAFAHLCWIDRIPVVKRWINKEKIVIIGGEKMIKTKAGFYKAYKVDSKIIKF